MRWTASRSSASSATAWNTSCWARRTSRRPAWPRCEALCAREAFDAVAVELCESRERSMRDPDAFKRMDLFQVIRQGKVGMVAASLVLGSFQKRLAEQYGIEPGAEMKAAMQCADR